MSDSQTYDPVTVSSDGVTVAKRFEADEFPVPAIAFRIESSRSETVSVKLVDSVPEDVAVEDLGFHPEYGSEYWTIDDQTITFERDIEPESEYTTVYGIRSTGTDNVEQFLTEPSIEEVDPPLDDGDDGDVLDESSSDVVKDVIAGESDSVPGLDEDEDEEIETLNLKDPNDPEAAQEAEGEGDAGEDSQSSRVTTQLLAEIHHDAVDDDVVRALRKELSVNGSGGGGDGGGGGAVDARIQHLQNEVSDLTAYTQALEEFLADNGTGDEMIEDFRDRLSAFENELDQIQGMAMENQEAMDQVESEVDRVSGQVSGVEDTVDSMEESVNNVDDTVETLDAEVDALSTEVTSVDDELDSLHENVDSIEGDVGSFDESISSLEEEVESMRGDLEDVQNQIGDVSDIDNQIEDIQNEIEELKEWREQLSSVIGGGD